MEYRQLGRSREPLRRGKVRTDLARREDLVTRTENGKAHLGVRALLGARDTKIPGWAVFISIRNAQFMLRSALAGASTRYGCEPWGHAWESQQAVRSWKYS